MYEKYWNSCSERELLYLGGKFRLITLMHILASAGYDTAHCMNKLNFNKKLGEKNFDFHNEILFSN